MTQLLPTKNLVLYADDDPDDLLMIREAFHPYSHSIELQTFWDGVELIRYVEQLSPLTERPCLIILDINMPRQNGFEVLKRLRQMPEMAGVPVVLFSTSTLPAEAAEARSHGAGFVTKPLIASQIHQITEVLLSHCSNDLKQKINRRLDH